MDAIDKKIIWGVCVLFLILILGKIVVFFAKDIFAILGIS